MGCSPDLLMIDLLTSYEGEYRILIELQNVGFDVTEECHLIYIMNRSGIAAGSMNEVLDDNILVLRDRSFCDDVVPRLQIEKTSDQGIPVRNNIVICGNSIVLSLGGQSGATSAFRSQCAFSVCRRAYLRKDQRIVKPSKLFVLVDR